MNQSKFRTHLIIILLAISATQFFAQITHNWTGNVDNLWNEAGNWDTNSIPGTGDFVEIGNDVSISGTAPSTIAQVKIKGKASVTLNLDLMITSATDHSILINAECMLQLSGASFTLAPPSNKDGIAIFGSSDQGKLVIDNATLNISSGNNGLNFSSPTSLLDNQGTITLSGVKTGIKNLGKVINTNSITITDPTDDGIFVDGGGQFLNTGSINLKAKDGASNSNLPISLGTSSTVGIFINEGSLIIDGGSGTSARGIQINNVSQFTNTGSIKISNGDTKNRINNKGTFLNDINGSIDFQDGRGNVSSGTFTNNGFIQNNGSFPGIFTGSNGTSINNAFFAYTQKDVFSAGAGSVTDNGIDILNDILDAAEECMIDIAEVSYPWFDGATSLGSSDGSGLLSIAEGTNLSSNPATLTTSIPGVSIKVANFCTKEVIPVIPSLFIWDAGGDGVTWNDPLNWDSDMIPVENVPIEINDDVELCGSGVFSASQLKIGSKTKVTILTNMFIGGAEEHAIIIGNESSLTIGGSKSVVVSLAPGKAKNAVNIASSAENVQFLVKGGSTLNIDQGSNGINAVSAKANLTNNGTININNCNNGIKIKSGFRNQGHLSISNSTNKGIIVDEGYFQNSRTIMLVHNSNTSIDVINQGTFVNEASIAYTGIAGKGISVGSGEFSGSFYNTGEFRGGAIENIEVILIQPQGQFINTGRISIWGFENKNAITSRGQFLNKYNAVISLDKAAVFINKGDFLNNGLVESTIAGEGITAGNSAILTNNAFFKYSGSSQFASGGNVTDLGMDANNAYINAAGSCTIDIAEQPYNWRDNHAVVGRATETGSLSISEYVSLSSQPAILNTSLPGVEVTVSNFCYTPPVTEWDGEGDGTSWQDPINWSNDLLPVSGELIEVGIDAHITGIAEQSPGQIKINGASSVTLDLDLEIGGADAQAIVLGAKSNLFIGTDSTTNTLTLNPTGAQNAINIGMTSDSSVVVISKNSNLNLNNGLNGINVASPTSTIINNGYIQIDTSSNGLKILGTFINNGHIKIDPVEKRAIVLDGGTFDNIGEILISQAGKDGIAINKGGMMHNSGRISSIVRDLASLGDAALEIGGKEEGDEGFFINEVGALLELDGGPDSLSRTLNIAEQGSLTNYGLINIIGGDEKGRLYNRGITTNQMNATINLNDGRANINQGSFTNNGLVKSKRGGSGLFSGEGAVLTNNAFFDYQGSGAFAIGKGEITDNGLDVFEAQLDAEMSCSIDLAQQPYIWFIEDVLVDTATAEGLLTFPAEFVLDSETSILTTTLEGVQIEVTNLCEEISGIVRDTFMWTGLGDQVSWNDKKNWDLEDTPRNGSVVIIGQDVSISGSSSSVPAQLNIHNHSKVVLDLDLSIGGDTIHSIIVNQGAELHFGSENNGRVFSLSPSSSAHAILIGASANNTYIKIHPNSSINISQASTGINIKNESTQLVNEGAINVWGSNNGIILSGNLVNTGKIEIGMPDNVGLNVQGGNVYNSNLINIDKSSKAGIRIVDNGMVINEGTITGSLSSIAGVSSNQMLIGSTDRKGTFINESTGKVVLDGGSSSLANVLFLNPLGELINEGHITLKGGDENARFYSRGILSNALNAILDLTDGRGNVNENTFTNKGLIISSSEHSGLLVEASGRAINKAFFKYENDNTWAIGDGEKIDMGINANDASINALESCSIDLAESPYKWYDGHNLVGTSNEEGLLEIDVNTQFSSYPIILHTTLQGVSVTITDLCAVSMQKAEEYKTEWKSDSQSDTNSNLRSEITYHEAEIFPSLITTEDAINVNLSDHPSENLKFGLFDFSGNKIAQYHIQAGQITALKIANLSAGYYILRSMNSKKLIIGKFTVQK